MTVKNLGKAVGYIVSYFLFTTILYYILVFLNKIPTNWSYFHIMGITLLIALLGFLIKKGLK